MLIRQAKKSDFPCIEKIYTLSKLDELRFESSAFKLLPLLDDKPRLNALLESDILVYDDNGVIAYGAVCDAEIRGLFVHPASRDQGVGQKLLAQLINKAKHPATLNIAKSNTPARTLYEKFGFKITEDFETSYNGTPLTASRMQVSTMEKSS